MKILYVCSDPGCGGVWVRLRRRKRIGGTPWNQNAARVVGLVQSMAKKQEVRV